MDKRDQLELAWIQLYAVFARYPPRRTMWACPHCVEHEEIVALTTGPLHSLSWDDLDRYLSKAMTTWGDSEDFRSFLPRLLELCVVDPGLHAQWIETICRKLKHAQWAKWPEEERQAIIECLLAFWQLLLSYAVKCSANDFLEALSQALEDLSSFLHAWRQSKEATALRTLANFVNENSNELGSDRMLRWRFGSPLTKRQVIAWLLEPETRQWLEDGFFRTEEKDVAEELAVAADTLFFLNEAGW